MRRGITFLVACSAAAIPAGVLALSPIGAQFQVNTFSQGNQGNGSQSSCGYWKHRSQDVASDAAGNFVVVWQSEGQDGDYGGIFAQRFDRDGVKLGTEFQVNATSAGDQRTPVVAMGAAGNFVVAWESRYGGGYYTADVFARRFDASGTPLGSEFQVSANGYSYGGYRRFAYSSVQNPEARLDVGGNLVVVWEREADYADGRQIMARRFDASGAALGGTFQVSDGTYETYTRYFYRNRTPDVGVDPSGGFVVVWFGTRSDDVGGYAVVGRRYDAAGNSQSGEFQVNTQRVDSYYGDPIYSHWESSPSVEGTSDGRFLVAWSSETLDSEGGGEGYYDVATRFLNSDGTPTGADLRVNTTSDHSWEGCPTIAEIGPGDFVVTWRRFGYPVVQAFGQRIDSSGTLVGSEFLVNTDAARAHVGHTPVVAAQGSGFVAVWTDAGYGGVGTDDGWDIFGQRFGALSCAAEPLTGCREVTEPRGSVIRYQQNKLAWRWTRGEATSRDDFGDPKGDTDYAFCMYDASGSSQPLVAASLPAAGTCGSIPCWRDLSGPGLPIEYYDRLAAKDGILRVRLRPGSQGKAQVAVGGRDEDLGLPSGPLTAPVTVQLQASNGECWTAEYGTFIKRNESSTFVARSGSPP